MAKLNPAALKAIRQAKRISQRQVARQIKASSGYISRVEAGNFVPRDHQIPKIAEAIGESVDAITWDPS